MTACFRLCACCLLPLAVIAVFCLTFPARAAADSRKIVFIRANFKPDHGSAMVERFKATLRKRGYVEGKDIEYVDILANKPCREAVKLMLHATELHQESTDLFVTAGWISLPARTKLSASRSPQLFAPVLREEAMVMLPSVNEEPGANLSGVYLSYPPEKILRLTRQLLPQVKNYAYVFDAQLSTDLVLKTVFEKLQESDRHGMTVHYLNLAGGVEQVLQQMKALRIEAFGGIIGAYKNREALAASGLPMITALIMDIEESEVADRIRESNMLAGLFSPLDYCGEQAGEMAADFLDGKKNLAATVPRPARQVAFVNMRTAERLRIPVPFAVLEAVDIVVK
jgi:putative ABC transport system substrate-binding protein